MPIAYRASSRLVDAFRAFELLRGLDLYYPEFDDWFVNKAVPDVVLGNGSLILAEDGDEVVGMALSRRGGSESKLRCVRVVPRLQNRGVGLHLIDRSLAAIGADKPVVSVSEEMLDGYARAFVNRYGFELTWVEKGLYRPGRLEYFFNAKRGRPAESPYGGQVSGELMAA